MVHAAIYNDGRQRAQLLGDSTQGKVWVDRVKIPSGGRVRAHTDTHGELVTIIEGAWYVGQGDKFDGAKLKGYPAGELHCYSSGAPALCRSKER